MEESFLMENIWLENIWFNLLEQTQEAVKSIAEEVVGFSKLFLPS